MFCSTQGGTQSEKCKLTLFHLPEGLQGFCFCLTVWEARPHYGRELACGHWTNSGHRCS